MNAFTILSSTSMTISESNLDTFLSGQSLTMVFLIRDRALLKCTEEKYKGRNNLKLFPN
eukprot:CAMPEP_0172544082 /NCGR_PEP_ID=MMETSP1067-20121228/14317_1 /TAXON_ID=265564 ORGANISM="Thalassiosira punctigera, Strain Tpunct2005C2" /NCGR_SAMPLE_ID=MMETSP1067 /ASSEMBLY_ACC=CAM_ASM_000444 /LENGTH=58 /DNA_ID=CAMNT_0013330585 /DNA_START=379 /DNA_END=552 /DNA_ORIENTATION=+